MVNDFGTSSELQFLSSVFEILGGFSSEPNIIENNITLILHSFHLFGKIQVFIYCTAFVHFHFVVSIYITIH